MSITAAGAGTHTVRVSNMLAAWNNTAAGAGCWIGTATAAGTQANTAAAAADNATQLHRRTGGKAIATGRQASRQRGTGAQRHTQTQQMLAC